MEETDPDNVPAKRVEWTGEFQEVTIRDVAISWPLLPTVALLIGTNVIGLAVWFRRRRRNL